MISEQQRWSSGETPSFCDWVEAAKTHILDLTLGSPCRSEFRACFVQRRVGPLAVTAIHASQSVAERHLARHRAAPMRYELKYVRQGTFRIEQAGQILDVDSGNFVLIDNNCNFKFATSRTIECVTLCAPDNWLRARLPDPEGCLLQPIDKHSVWARGLALVVCELADLAPGDHPLPGELIAEQCGGFMTLLFAQHEAHTTPYKQRLVRALIRAIQCSHHDPEVTPATVAAELRISKRYLHALLASSGTTFGRELLTARLAHARALLEDHRFRFTAVNEVALLCGFTDPAHFTRRFRQYWGRSPSEHRATSCPGLTSPFYG